MIIYAPFTADQVKHINQFQTAGCVHEFTCANSCRAALVAEPGGLFCPVCDYVQNWVHEGMADGSWLSSQRDIVRSMRNE
jgi:uncharacterized Zn finger protein (UPF0148 family)